MTAQGVKKIIDLNKVTEANMQRLAQINELITVGGDAAYLKKLLTGVYMKYTRLLIADPDNKEVDTDSQLYYLSLLIEALE